MSGRTLIVVDDVTKMVTTAVVCFAHAHRVVREVNIAIIACGLVSKGWEKRSKLGR
jgi:hypothetical protein